MDNLYRWLQSVTQKFGYNFEVKRFDAEAFPAYVGLHFIELLQKYRDKTMVPWGGLLMAYQAASYVSKNRIPGAIVECGVWRGGCSLIMAEAIAQGSHDGYEFYLYDTYAGMTDPGEKDDSSTGHARNLFSKTKKGKDYIDWCYAPVEEVWKNIIASGYPIDRVKLVKGKVEDTIPETVPDQIALLRIDTDFYESTRHEMEHLFPRLVRGGVFICDDYGFWEGAQKAVDEYLAKLEEPFLLTVDSGTGRAIGVRR